MADKIRGALFNVLGDIEGLTVLDAFAGSGGLSFEAISRGAKNAIAIDHDGSAHKTLMRNIQDLGLEREVKATKANASGWSDNNSEAQFDIVILAPPYDNLQKNLLAKLVKHTKKDGILVLDWPRKEEIPEFAGLEQITDKNYGDAQLVFYRKL
jgi:16S rRNA (guanine966-N2)-methyltransferase